MNISTKGRYGLKAILDIAQFGAERPVTLSSVSRRLGISEGYLEQLMAPMKKCGLVKSVRGALGGYLLSRPPREIVVGEVFRALEGPISIASCATENPVEKCEYEENCLTKEFWRRTQLSVASVIDSYTLADLLPGEKKDGKEG
ncbi:MAG: Rrf2 family transcriptional regulator [Clostridiales bacterium]|nr:Rrf2 family transcriptional regulator [Clostridiales bacterium]